MISLRGAIEGDREFILPTWLQSHKHRKDDDITTDIYQQYYGNIVKDKLNSKNIKIVVAASIEDHNQIFGYLVGENNLIHYIYVKFAFRRQGIARKLIDYYKFGDTITHKPLWWAKAKYDVKQAFNYNPYLFYTNKEVRNGKT
jgi:GNAT superfamily N-acetyltransferase